jgi:lipoate-protein ligase A
MIFIERPETNPYFNIAAEEYILKNTIDNVVMIWQCEPAVIIGKHQNTLTEVNFELTNELDIPVIRRISGGGTVYHDPGNINYTVITSEMKKDRLIDFRKFTQPIIDFLSGLGIEASFEGKNNLVIDGKKFSGNSAHVHKNRVLHHGTLLFNSNLEKLEKVIRPEELDIDDKAVKSIRATVTNISDYLDAEMNIQEFKAELKEYLLIYHKISKVRALSDNDMTVINKLVEEKYSQWQWNNGYSPAFTLTKEFDGITVVLKVKNGFIESIDIIGKTNPFFNPQMLTGLPYRMEDLRERMIIQEVPEEDIVGYLQLLGFY